MLTIEDLLECIIKEEDLIKDSPEEIKEETITEKIVNLYSKNIAPEVREYLKNKLTNLYIEVLGKHEGYLFSLMQLGQLEGWCWQTTESAIVFLNDNDYIERGFLRLDKRTPEYYHSWIVFKFNNTEYVFDPCLNILCEKEDYTKIFVAKVIGKVTAIEVKEELIRQIKTAKKDDLEEKETFCKFLKYTMGSEYESYMERKKEEVVVHGPEDANTPFYRNGCGYKAEIEDNMIRKLTVHYYYGDS